MARKYKPKNPHGKGAKLPPEMLMAIRLQYCKGKTQAETARVVSRWAKMQGLQKDVERQTVNARYAEIGSRLFQHAYAQEHGYTELVCDNCRDEYVRLSRAYLYASDFSFGFQRRRYRDVYGKKLGDEKFSTALREYHIDELTKASKQGNGLLPKTFYIQWARAYWWERFRIEHPEMNRAKLSRLIVQKSLEPLPPIKGTGCHTYEPSYVEWYIDKHGGFIYRVTFGRKKFWPADKKPVLFKAEQVHGDGALKEADSYFFTTWRMLPWPHRARWFEKITNEEGDELLRALKEGRPHSIRRSGT